MKSDWIPHEIPASAPQPPVALHLRGAWLCRATCRGHGCRVWDALVTSNAIVTASEDSLVRLFSMQGTLLRELQGAAKGVGNLGGFWWLDWLKRALSVVWDVWLGNAWLLQKENMKYITIDNLAIVGFQK